SLRAALELGYRGQCKFVLWAFGQQRWVMFPRDTAASAIGAMEGDAYKDGGPQAYWWLDHYPRLREKGKELGMARAVGRMCWFGLQGSTFSVGVQGCKLAERFVGSGVLDFGVSCETEEES
ncbi:unnamed protein product, partial [Symbiodinium sp. KB8]